jgi:protein transport protein SEC24
MTLRLSSGLVLYDYYTGNGRVSVRDLELSTIDADKSISIAFKHEDKINDNDAFIQYALLYTNVYGQRLIRVMNMQLQVVNKNSGNNPWHNIFKTADMDSVMMLFYRRLLPNIMQVLVK